MDRRSFFTKKMMTSLIVVSLIVTAAVVFAVQLKGSETEPQPVTDNNNTMGTQR